jgi:phosphorylcholine metabolism protein LicD
LNYQKTNKQNLPKWTDTLKYITSILKENNIKYYLSASGLEYILGSKKYPYDIDIFMSRENVRRVYKLLSKYKVSKLHYWEEDSTKLLEFQGKYDDIPFEICEWEEEPKKLVKKKFKGFEISIIG